MKGFVAIAVAASALSAPAMARAPDRGAELARLLAGRVAGEPVRCVNERRAHVTRIVNDTAFVYRIGNTLYVNRPRLGADALDRRDALVNRRGFPLLCEGDPLRSTDPYSGISKLVIVGDFVPYRRVRD